MNYLLSLIALMCTGPVMLVAQVNQASTEARKEITRLGFIVGEWKGNGWIMDRNGDQHEFTQSEEVQFKLDSTVILVEGVGKTEENIIHNALGIISYNPEDRNYTFRSYLSSGLSNTFTGELKGDVFYWYPGENMRYVVRINEEGQWVEKGEMNRGENWIPFLEMTLDKAE
jgi:hypothetical protein